MEEGGIPIIQHRKMLDTRLGTAAVDVEALMECMESCFDSSSRVALAPTRAGAEKKPATGRSLRSEDVCLAVR